MSLIVQKVGSAVRILFLALFGFTLFFTGYALITTGKISKGTGILVIFFALGGSIGIFNAINRHKRLQALREQSFEWYKQQNPTLVQYGRVSCSCGCSKIMIQHLMNQTYLRKHYCSACGKTLYYTRED